MDDLLTAIRKYWGYDTLRPLQHEAMTAALQRRDALVVLPTGGGKSLCYQAPALLSDALTVVVSPLIALMKDQVDRLLARNIPAAFINSSLDADDRRRVAAGLARREYRLLFVAPERFNDAFYGQLTRASVGAFAIDEAHCISHWGHDFRADYRRLGELKRRFPDACVHAFTATATPRVREDIIAQLGLHEPRILVGDFFRPNLRYRVVRRQSQGDVIDAVRDRAGQPGIVYCIRRADVDATTHELKRAGIRVAGYHAGMGDDERTRAQDAFAAGKADVVVATVAFGMGIDRADIRHVIHAAMPKSVEHYQQEAGRAGRDGKPADCILFYSGSDYQAWKTIIEDSEQADLEGKLRMLSDIYTFCSTATCRHRRLVSYFGQRWDRGPCGACDVCNGSFPQVADSTVLAQKIMSCVARTGQRFGAAHVADVLMGVPTDRVLERRHNELSTYSLLAEHDKKVLMAWMDQLVEQDLMIRDGEYRVLKLTPRGWDVLRSKADATLYDVTEKVSPRRRTRKKPLPVSEPAPEPPARDVLDAEARELYEKLRTLRRRIADENNIPGFMVFSDKTLREMARTRPTTEDAMLAIRGIGPAKLESYGRAFLHFLRTGAEA